MKRIHLVGFLTISLFAVIYFGCSNDNFDEYYVNYSVSFTIVSIDHVSPTIDSGIKLNIIYNNEDGYSKDVNINAGTNWEIVIGTVKRGYNAELSMGRETEISMDRSVWRETEIPDKLNCSIWIEVSKNGGPFYMKKGTGGSTPLFSPLHINYIIE